MAKIFTYQEIPEVLSQREMYLPIQSQRCGKTKEGISEEEECKYFVILQKLNNSISFYHWFSLRSCLLLFLSLFDLTRKVIILPNYNNRMGILGISDRIIYESRKSL